MPGGIYPSYMLSIESCSLCAGLVPKQMKEYY